MIVNSLTKSLQSVKFRWFIELIELYTASYKEEKEMITKSWRFDLTDVKWSEKMCWYSCLLWLSVRTQGCAEALFN